YTYDTDELGRVERVSGELHLDAADRNTYRQQQAGGAERLTTDDGGHLVGSQFDGPGEAINLIAQNRGINRSGGQWYALESTWQTALNRGHQVSVDIQPVFPVPTFDRTPSRFVILSMADRLPARFRIPPSFHREHNTQ
ncbi:MAG: hypothetical protein HC808_12210, partial [Candidatus Competibacteraceae bacterium]|nr:hypothetical protein [Candidatus Competibacteraceae bacterium]